VEATHEPSSFNNIILAAICGLFLLVIATIVVVCKRKGGFNKQHPALALTKQRPFNIATAGV
jgi:hypothetical protein